MAMSALPPQQVELPVVDEQLDRDPLMPCPELGEQVVEDAVGQGFRAGDAQVSGQTGIPAGDVAVERQGLLLHALGGEQHTVSRVGRHIGAAVALEQPDLELRLQRVEPAKDRGVVVAELLGSALQRAGPADRQDQPKVVPVHIRLLSGQPAAQLVRTCGGGYGVRSLRSM
ncbi:hypothetical protein ACVIHD_005296 [Bradyrhizobium embrapense]